MTKACSLPRYAIAMFICLLIANASPGQTEEANVSSRPLFREIQKALDAVSRAELVREGATLTGQPSPQLDKARKLCRNAITGLRQLETKLAQLLRETYATRPSQRQKNAWSTRELESLTRNLQVQLARAYRNQALCYAAGSIDRLNSLSLALERLPEIVTQPIDDSSVWRARVEQVACLRLLNKLADAQQLAAKWLDSSPPKTFAARLQSEQIRLALASQASDQALKLVDTITANPQRSRLAELDDAILAALLAAQDLADPEQSTRLIKRATAQLSRIAELHGPYWQRRAQFRFGQAMQSRMDSDDPQLLTYAAASLYAVAKYDQAVAAYDRIATLHQTNGDHDEQFSARSTAAAIVQEQQQTSEARKRFRQLALDHPAHEQAADMHLVAVGLAAKELRQAPAADRAEVFDLYRELVNEHLRLWPDGSTAKQAKAWQQRMQTPALNQQQARRLAERGQREPALSLYRQLAAESPEDLAIQEELATLLAEGNEKVDWREALPLWQQIEKRSKPGSQRWWRGRRARLTLLEQLGEGEQAKQLRQLTEILYE